METFVLGFAAVIFCSVHSLTASTQMKSLASRRFGQKADRWYRLGFNIFSGLSFLPILWLLDVLPDQALYILKFPWWLPGILGQLAGVAIILVGMWQTGLLSFLGIDQVVSSRGDRGMGVFVKHGLYRWVRHPLYTGGFLFIWCTPVMTRNLLVLFLQLSLYLVFGARLEEKRLVAEFGEEYQLYQKEVPMLFPKFQHIRLFVSGDKFN